MFWQIFTAIAKMGLQANANKISRHASRSAIGAEEDAARRAEEEGAFIAEQDLAKADQELAIGSREKGDEARRGRTLVSDAKAIGAASGAGGYESTIADIQGEADYQMLAAMYNRRQNARDLRVAAGVAKREAADKAAGHLTLASAYRSQAKIDRLKGYSDMLGGASDFGGTSMAGKYGSASPSTSASTSQDGRWA